MRMLSALWMVLTLSVAAQEQIVPHITRSDGEFDTTLILANQADANADVSLRLYSAQGALLEQSTISIPALTTRYQDAEDWPAAVAHISVNAAPSLTVQVMYRARTATSGPAHVLPTLSAALAWRFHAGDPAVTWDGLALVNKGEQPADVYLRRVDASGQVLDSQALFQALPVEGKALHLFENQPASSEQHHYELIATEPVVLVALRGNQAADFLWSNAASPFHAPAASRVDAQFTELFPGVNFGSITDIKPLADGSGALAVVSREGLIQTMDPATDATSPLLFLNLADQIVASGEQGLLGLAFHPDYANNGRFFVNYTTNRSGGLRTVIAEFQLRGDGSGQADPTSETILLEVPQPFSNHNGGAMAFGPDGYLYLAFGDGGGAGDPQNHAQNRTNLLGTISRIDVDSASPGLAYGIPADNPFAATGDETRAEIFAYGLRNPWRMAFDGDDLWAADVGQDAFEEINRIHAGGNYGWRITEGFACFNPADNCPRAGLTPPVFAYPHTQGDRSITGGYVYRGRLFPDLVGHYVYGDFISGRVWALNADGDTALANVQIGQVDPFRLTTFGVDTQGELVLGLIDGRVLRLAAP